MQRVTPPTQAIILAAGMGRRLGAGRPKCLLDVGGASILHRQLAAFRSAGIEHFVLVVGYACDQVCEHVADQPGRIEFIINERYAETNTIYSLYLARQWFGAGFYYANGDVVFDRRLVERLRDASDPDVLAVKPERCGQEEVKVVVRGDRIVGIGKELDPARSLGEFVGVARFGAGLVPSFAQMLAICVEAEGIVGDHFERAVDRLCSTEVLKPLDVSDLPCGEVDFPEDLEHARRDIVPRLVI